MAVTQAPGTGFGPEDKHRRRAVVAGVALVCAAIVVPFGLHGVRGRGADASAATPTTTASPRATTQHRAPTDTRLGYSADLPALLPARSTALRDGLRVRVGDITGGTVRHPAAGGWQVVVRWNGRPQPLPTRGPVSLADSSWVSRSGTVYTRVATDTAGRFRVYAWDPVGGSVYTPPTLVATSLGHVCFDAALTAYGDCS